MTDDELRDLFEPFGEVESAAIITNRDTGRSRGFGFVEMIDDTAAGVAIGALNEKDIGGRALVVNQARPRTDRGDNGGGGRGRGRGRGGDGDGDRGY